MMKSNLTQETFDFPQRTYMERDDFIVSECNEAAFKAIDLWPEWMFFALWLFGPKGCGKSHLGNLFAEKVMAHTGKPQSVQIIRAENIASYQPEKIFEESPCIIVENITEDINNEAMFHLYNQYRNNGGNILFLSEKSPSRMNFSLPDLSSRLRAVPTIEILQPSDEMLNMLLLNLFSDRQLKVSAEVLRYALSNMTRSFVFAQKLVAEADRVSLIKKSPISINVIKDALELLNNNRQQELFE